MKKILLALALFTLPLCAQPSCIQIQDTLYSMGPSGSVLMTGYIQLSLGYFTSSNTFTITQSLTTLNIAATINNLSTCITPSVVVQASYTVTTGGRTPVRYVTYWYIPNTGGPYQLTSVPSGIVNVSGTPGVVTWVSGRNFANVSVNDTPTINGASSASVASIQSVTQITMNSGLGTLSGVTFTDGPIERGGVPASGTVPPTIFGPPGIVGPPGSIAGSTEYSVPYPSGTFTMTYAYCSTINTYVGGNAAATFTMIAPVANCTFLIQNNTTQPLVADINTNSVTWNGGTYASYGNKNPTLAPCSNPANGCQAWRISANGTTSWDVGVTTGNFSQVSSGTNTLAAMVVGSGASLDVANGGIVNANNVYVYMPNGSSGGTVVNEIARINNIGGVATVSSLGTSLNHNTDSLGVCVSGCGTTGIAKIQTSGQTMVNFDGSTVAGDAVGLSASVTGYATDLGTTSLVPGGSEFLGRVITTNSGAGVYPVLLKEGINPSVFYRGNGPLSALPSTCAIGQLFFVTDATAGRNIYMCSSPNTWTQVI